MRHPLASAGCLRRSRRAGNGCVGAFARRDNVTLYSAMHALARVVEWQTRRSQKPLRETSCGFDSHPGHHNSLTSCINVFLKQNR